MTYRDGSVADLRNALQRAQAEIVEAQSILGVAKDKADGARQIIEIATEESGRAEVDAAKAALNVSNEKIDEAILLGMSANEQLDQYAGTL